MNLDIELSSFTGFWLALNWAISKLPVVNGGNESTYGLQDIGWNFPPDT